VSTDPMTIRLAVETLLPIAESIDLRVPAADFPTWADALPNEHYRTIDCYDVRDGTYRLSLYAVITDEPYQVALINAKVTEPPEGIEFRAIEGGTVVATVTRAQLDYLAPFKAGDTVERIDHETGEVWYTAQITEVAPDGLITSVLDDSTGRHEHGDRAIAPFTAYGKPCWRKVEVQR
jgi:hypothetical protein